MTSKMAPTRNILRSLNKDLEQTVEDFLDSRRIDRGAADKTIEAYRCDLRQFLESLPAERLLSDLTEEDVTKYLASLKKSAPESTSVARKMSSLRQFFKFCCLEKGLLTNPTENLSPPKLPAHLPKALTEEQARALLKAADQGLPYTHNAHASSLRLRDQTLIYLLYATGLRVSELAGLCTGDVDFQNAYVRVTGKGDKQRIAPFAPLAGELLHRFIEEERPKLQPQSNHIFINQRGFALTRQSLWKTLLALGEIAGLRDTVSPHTLRHTFATHLLQSGMNLRSLQLLLGHSDLSTTQIYTQVRPEHLKSIVKKYHPRGE